MRSLLAVLLLSCAGCAVLNSRPPRESPYRVYVIGYGNKAGVHLTNVPPDKFPVTYDVPVDSLRGAVCTKPDDWERHQLYIHELEER